jgi:hypothetical protein
MRIRLFSFAVRPVAIAGGIILGLLSGAYAQVITEFSVPTTVTRRPIP